MTVTAARRVSADAHNVSYVSDTTRENESSTHQKALVGYVDDNPKATLDNRRSVAALQRSLAQDVLSALPAVTVPQRHTCLLQRSTDGPGVNTQPVAGRREGCARLVNPDGFADFILAKPRVPARHALTTHVLDDGVTVNVVPGSEVVDCHAGAVIGGQLLEFLRSKAVLTLPWRHPCGPVDHAVRDHLREFPQVTRGVRGVGVTSYKVHSVVDSTTFEQVEGTFWHLGRKPT